MTLLCPSCQVDLTMSNRQGVEIDYCPKCRGVWLDRGELDKIIEMSTREGRIPSQAPQQPHEDRRRFRDDDDDDDRFGSDRDRRGRGGWLSNIFD